MWRGVAVAARRCGRRRRRRRRDRRTPRPCATASSSSTAGSRSAPLSALVVLLVRSRRRRTSSRERDDLRLAAVIALAVVAATAYNGVLPACSAAADGRVYAVPLIAIFLAAPPPARLARPRGRWRSSAPRGSRSSPRPASVSRSRTRAPRPCTVRGAGGSLAETPTRPRSIRAALDAIERETAPGEPILVAPLLTGPLRALRPLEPALPEISLLPGRPRPPGGRAGRHRDLERDPSGWS